MTALRARLKLALVADGFRGSLYLLVIASCWLACDSASVRELGMLESIFYQQAAAESLDGDEVITALLLEVPS